MILGHSRAKYIEFVKRCDLRSMERCMLNAFQYFGGVPKEVLTDNMKTVCKNRCLDRSCGKFLRLFQGFVLTFIETVGVAPGNGMCSQQHFQISRIDVQQITAAIYSRCCARIAVGYTETPALVIYKAVKGDLSFRAEIESSGTIRSCSPHIVS